ncbi:Uu.00g141150.m01.CDS01 [Anthostomella pinea]|uniref:Uu.00g141150.m01.CDS01 n=1 Tax=Anthostomella pinea TaxID=933095 RepID=A0AAI8VR11_9PEZI|nr:Uu.00g141150.m01.CDS01 [Anthostomella pinea]
MPSYQYENSYHRSHELAHRLRKETRHSHYPTRYIVNDGQLFVDEKSLRHSNTVIYNSPGSTMWLTPSSRHHSTSAHNPHHHSTSSSAWVATTTQPATMVCLGCHEHRVAYYGSYCRDCTAARLAPVPERRQLDYPERRAIGWR